MVESMIRGWKPYTLDGKPGFVACPIDDPGCTRWEVCGPGLEHWMAIECDSLYRAERLESAFRKAFEAGRKARTKELQAFIAGAGL